MKNAARTLGLQPQLVQVRRTDEIESASLRTSRERAGALLTFSDAMFILQRAELVELPPHHLINVTTAKALSVTLPPSLLARADEVTQ